MSHDFSSYESSDGIFRHAQVSQVRMVVQPLTADILLARIRAKKNECLVAELRRDRHLPSMRTNQFAGWISTKRPVIQVA